MGTLTMRAEPDLERRADDLLALAGQDTDYPFYTEKELRRRERYAKDMYPKLVAEMEKSGRLVGNQEAQKKNYFQCGIEFAKRLRLGKTQTRVFVGLLMGYTREEVGVRCGVTHQYVSKVLYMVVAKSRNSRIVIIEGKIGSAPEFAVYCGRCGFWLMLEPDSPRLPWNCPDCRADLVLQCFWEDGGRGKHKDRKQATR